MAKPFFDLEELIVDAWPAAETVDYHGWLLRSSGGPSRRANSVASLSWERDAPSLEEGIEFAEAFYRERGQRVLFQIGPCAQPKELEATLQARGYQQDGVTAVMLAAPADLAKGPRPVLDVRVDTRPSKAWREIAFEQSRFAQASDSLRDLLQRLGSRVRYVTAYENELACACCYAIASEDRLGVYGMLTLPTARRRGAARAMLCELGAFARREQLRDIYLLVELENVAARALYVQCGFADAYNYHYRGEVLDATP